MNKIVLANTSMSNTTPLQFIDAAAGAGYDGVGIRVYRSPGITYNFTPIAGDAAMMRDVKNALTRTGLMVNEVLSFYIQPEMDHEDTLGPLAFAGEIGAKYALVIGDDADWPRMVDNFGKFCDNAAGFGITAAIEAPVFSRKVNNLKAALKLVADAGRKNAMISIDPYQFFRTGHTPADLDGIDPEIFSWTQLTDGLLDPPGFRVPGTGAVPLAEILDRLPPQLLLSLECGAPRDSNYTPAEWAKIALAGTRSFLEGYYAAKN